jgi:hypothetical protein
MPLLALASFLCTRVGDGDLKSGVVAIPTASGWITLHGSTQGLSNPEIAEALVLSLYTLQDHVKNLIEKTDVASRRELVARIFLDDYLPQIVRRAPLSSDGGFTA